MFNIFKKKQAKVAPKRVGCTTCAWFNLQEKTCEYFQARMSLPVWEYDIDCPIGETERTRKPFPGGNGLDL